MSAVAKNISRIEIFRESDHYCCQVGATQIANGDLIVVFNEARGLSHQDFDSISLVRSKDNGTTWDRDGKIIAWPCTHHFGSDTPSITQLTDGTLIINYIQWAFVEQKGILEDLGPQARPMASRGETRIKPMWRLCAGANLSMQHLSCRTAFC